MCKDFCCPSINMKEQKNKSNRIMQELYTKRLNLLIHGLNENEMNEFESRKEIFRQILDVTCNS